MSLLKIDPEDAVWNLVLFDLPVTTKLQRREALNFRNLLLDEGYWMVQFSVYVKYAPTASMGMTSIKRIKQGLPPGGEVRMLNLTDKQWAKGLRFSNDPATVPQAAPQQLTIF